MGSQNWGHKSGVTKVGSQKWGHKRRVTKGGSQKAGHKRRLYQSILQYSMRYAIALISSPLIKTSLKSDISHVLVYEISKLTAALLVPSLISSGNKSVELLVVSVGTAVRVGLGRDPLTTADAMWQTWHTTDFCWLNVTIVPILIIILV